MIEARAARPDEYEAIGRLCDRAFVYQSPPFPPDPGSGAGEGYSLEHNIVRVVTRSHPQFDPEHLRVALADPSGPPVSMVLFIACRLRIGRGVVPANIVAPVATDPAFQGQGYGVAVMQDALAAMRRAGHVFSQLWGIPEYYGRFGYSPSLPWCGVTVKPDELHGEALPPYQVVPFDPVYIPDLVTLWHDNTAALTLADVCDTAPWRWQPQAPASNYGVLLDPGSAVAGYYQAVAGPGRLEVYEAAIRDPAAGVALLVHLRDLSLEWGAAALNLGLALDHPLARLAWRHGGTLHTAHSQAGFARVLDLPGLFDALREEFNRRLAHSELHNHTGMLAVSCEEGGATLALRGGLLSGVMPRAVNGAPVLELPLAQLNPLVTGLRPLSELLTEAGVSITPGARRLAEVLFPAGYPRTPYWPIFQV